MTFTWGQSFAMFVFVGSADAAYSVLVMSECCMLVIIVTILSLLDIYNYILNYVLFLINAGAAKSTKWLYTGIGCSVFVVILLLVLALLFIR